MIHAHTAQAVRDAERPLLEAGEPLMLRAAAALAASTREVLSAHGAPRGHVLVLVGPGNNGGDGLHAAAMLRRDGIAADALLLLGRPHAEGAAALEAAGGEIHARLEDAPSLLARADVLLDAVLGTGGRAEAPQELRSLLRRIRHSGRPVIAVDAPSFLDATTGQTDPDALPAERTVTFGAATTGLLLPPASRLVGHLEVIDIGLGPHLPETPALTRWEQADVAAAWQRPGPEDSKYTRGVLAVLAGSEAYPGAAVLTCSAAVRSGAGMVRLLAGRRVADLVLAARPEVVTHPTGEDGDWADQLPERTDALAIGPGTSGEDPRLRAGIALLRRGGRLGRGVIDAGALGAVEPEDSFTPDVVLTPHLGEARRLAERLGVPPEQPPARLAADLAEATGATCLLKGSPTLILAPDGTGSSQADGPGRLAAAGSGDVLTGIIGALLAGGWSGPDAAAAGSLLHGRSAHAAPGGPDAPLAPLDLAHTLPQVLGTILSASAPLNRGER